MAWGRERSGAGGTGGGADLGRHSVVFEGLGQSLLFSRYAVGGVRDLQGKESHKRWQWEKDKVAHWLVWLERRDLEKGDSWR